MPSITAFLRWIKGLCDGSDQQIEVNDRILLVSCGRLGNDEFTLFPTGGSVN
ncbi:MAG: hypothetical protein KDB22_05850 [Planctomycetales bacterium]|nr:hypothetical protein [Planctomycetales bacterium]